MTKDEMIGRWLTPDGIQRRRRVLELIKSGGEWPDALIGFPGVDEVRAREDLRGIDFSGEDLTHAQLPFVNFECARLDGATLTRADLTSAQLCGTSFVRAHARNCGLVEVDATGARFDCADLIESLMFHSNFVEASFRGANLEGADLSRCKLRGADFSDAKMAGVDLLHAWTEGAISLPGNLEPTRR